MKKDRNTFFQESQVFNQSGFPNMNIANAPYTSSYSNNSFYAGPTPNMQVPLNYNTPTYQNQNYNDNYSDLESRLSKIERQINRLDHRLSKLENNTLYSNDEIESNNNVYML